MASKIEPHSYFSLSSKSECKYNPFKYLALSQDKCVLPVEKPHFPFSLFGLGKTPSMRHFI